MKKRYQPISIVCLLLATTFLLGVIFVRYYEHDEIVANGTNDKNTEEMNIAEDIIDTELVENTETDDSVGIVGTTEFVKPAEPVVKFVASDISYFDDALFIGDSRVNGINCYGTFDNATFFTEDGMNIYELWQIRVPVEGYGRVYLADLMARQSYSKIYIMLGINELGEDQAVSAQKYKDALDRIHELAPDAIVYICANLHVSEKQSLRDRTFNNTNINAYNERLKGFADNEIFFYLDVNQVFNDEAGNLKAEYTWDNVHLYGRHYDEWCEWFAQNTVQKYQTEVEGSSNLEE